MSDKGRRLAVLLACCLGTLSVRQAGAEPDGPAGDGAVTVLFRGIHSHTGWLRISLYARADGFPGDERKAYRSREVGLQGGAAEDRSGSVMATFDGLPAGVYAVSAYRDANGDGRLDTDRLGRPREDWGVSNNPRPLFRAPRFQEAGFRLRASERRVVALTLRH